MQSVTTEYKAWLIELKQKIRTVQLKAAVAVNTALIGFYWELGKMISLQQTHWGSHFLEQVSRDLKAEFPEMQGFSVTNLKYCRLFYNFFSIRPRLEDELKNTDRPQAGDDLVNPKPEDDLFNLVTRIPWGHIKELISKIKDQKEAQFYIQQTITEHWSRDVLALQIKSDLYKRQGKSVNNFKETLPDPLSDLAQQTLKDPYVFDFMTMAAPYKEKDIEESLIEHVSKFLLELGKGFAFVGRQYHMEIAQNDYYLDLLFYHTRLKCYVV